MFKINGTNILLTRGDKCTITLKVTPKENEEFIFNPGDIISFSVYNKKGLDSEPLLSKETIINESTNIVDISLNGDDTKIGDLSNKPIDHWYDIQLNYDQTIIGYDNNGPKILTLYPEGIEAK